MVANRPLRFGDELAASALREMPWPEDALPAGAFAKIADLTTGKRIVLMPIDVNEAVLAAKVTGPGQRATLSAVLDDGMKAVTVRVNDVEGVAGFVLPGDHVDVLLTRQGEKNPPSPTLSSGRPRPCHRPARRPAHRKAVGGQGGHARSQRHRRREDRAGGDRRHAVAVAAQGRRSRRRRHAPGDDRRSRQADEPAPNSRFVTIGVNRPAKKSRTEYTVPAERGEGNRRRCRSFAGA